MVIGFSIYSLNAQSLQSPLFNPGAPADYNANLNVNDLAIAVDKGTALKKVKIFQKKDGLYQVGTTDLTEGEIKNNPNSLKWYKANSVYKYYDIGAFEAKAGKYKSVVAAYLLCFSQKYKMKIETVSGSSNWPVYFIKNEAEHEEQKKKLEELFLILDKDFPSLPNTFSPYDRNPLIWELVAKNRVELLACLSKNENPNITRSVDHYMKEIETAKQSAEKFNGGTADLYNGSTYDWMYRAVSKKARDEYFATQNGWNTNEGILAKFNTALDDLKTVCAPKLALLKMANELFQYHDAASEALMKGYLKNPATLKIYKTGIADADWIIVKNDLGVILNRYKRGTMWVRNSADDHPFCKGLFFVIKQDYSGGGSYGKPFINEYSEELRGCL